jgi:hypothetical protein
MRGMGCTFVCIQTHCSSTFAAPLTAKLMRCLASGSVLAPRVTGGNRVGGASIQDGYRAYNADSRGLALGTERLGRYEAKACPSVLFQAIIAVLLSRSQILHAGER